MGKIVLIVSWLLFASGIACAGTCLEGNCQDGFGTFQWSDGSKFTGTFASSAPYGEGIYTDPEGNEFHVTYQDGRPVTTTPVTKEEREQRLNHRQAEKYNAAGLVFLEKKDMLSAIYYFNKAITLWPDNPEFHRNYRVAKGLK